MFHLFFTDFAYPPHLRSRLHSYFLKYLELHTLLLNNSILLLRLSKNDSIPAPDFFLQDRLHYFLQSRWVCQTNCLADHHILGSSSSVWLKLLLETLLSTEELIRV